MKTTLASTARALTIVAAATLGLHAADASANSLRVGKSAADAPLTYVVKYGDLDISRVEGATTLYARIRHAASVVCTPFENQVVGLTNMHRVCLKTAIADAVARADRPLVSQIHQQRTGKLVRVSKAD